MCARSHLVQQREDVAGRVPVLERFAGDEHSLRVVRDGCSGRPLCSRLQDMHAEMKFRRARSPQETPGGTAQKNCIHRARTVYFALFPFPPPSPPLRLPPPASAILAARTKKTIRGLGTYTQASTSDLRRAGACGFTSDAGVELVSSCLPGVLGRTSASLRGRTGHTRPRSPGPTKGENTMNGLVGVTQWVAPDM